MGGIVSPTLMTFHVTPQSLVTRVWTLECAAVHPDAAIAMLRKRAAEPLPFLTSLGLRRVIHFTAYPAPTTTKMGRSTITVWTSTLLFQNMFPTKFTTNHVLSEIGRAHV